MGILGFGGKKGVEVGRINLQTLGKRLNQLIEGQNTEVKVLTGMSNILRGGDKAL